MKWRDNTISSNDSKCRKPYKSCPAAERICVISFGQCYSWTRENFSYFSGCLLNRCIKPNSYQSPDRFDPDTVLAQVRALAVVQTIQMRNFGFPVWFPFDVFIKRLTYLLFCSFQWYFAHVRWNIERFCPEKSEICGRHGRSKCD